MALTPAVHLCLSKSLLTLSLHSVLLYFDENYLLLQVIAMSVYCFHVLCRIKHVQVQVQVYICMENLIISVWPFWFLSDVRDTFRELCNPLYCLQLLRFIYIALFARVLATISILSQDIYFCSIPFAVYLGLAPTGLTYWDWDKRTTILQMIFVNEFSWMKGIAFWFEFHKSLFPRFQLTLRHH